MKNKIKITVAVLLAIIVMCGMFGCKNEGNNEHTDDARIEETAGESTSETSGKTPYIGVIEIGELLIRSNAVEESTKVEISTGTDKPAYSVLVKNNGKWYVDLSGTENVMLSLDYVEKGDISPEGSHYYLELPEFSDKQTLAMEAITEILQLEYDKIMKTSSMSYEIGGKLVGTYNNEKTRDIVSSTISLISEKKQIIIDGIDDFINGIYEQIPEKVKAEFFSDEGGENNEEQESFGKRLFEKYIETEIINPLRQTKMIINDVVPMTGMDKTLSNDITFLSESGGSVLNVYVSFYDCSEDEEKQREVTVIIPKASIITIQEYCNILESGEDESIH